MTQHGQARPLPRLHALVADTAAIQKLTSQLANANEQNRALKRTNQHLGGELRLAEKRFQTLLALDGATPSTRYQIRARHKTSESVATVQMSDWHVEERVKAVTVNGLNKFDLAVAEQRIQRLAENLLYLLRLNRHGTKIRTLVLQMLGDFMTGFIHMELVESNTLHPVPAVLWLYDRLCGFLDHIIEKSGCEEIIAVCTVGNHGRTTEKKRINTRVENSYEWLLFKMLSKKYPQIDWRIADGYFVYTNVFGAVWRHHHGDDLNYQGGVGGITIPVNKAIAQWDKTKRADYDWFGHWHQRIVMRKWSCNSSLIGYSAHALSIKAEYEEPSQNFSLWEKDHGLTVTAPIFLKS